jgi:flagellar biogenesis protein FliO
LRGMALVFWFLFVSLVENIVMFYCLIYNLNRFGLEVFSH